MSLQRLSLFAAVATLVPALAHAQAKLTPALVFLDAAPLMKLMMTVLVVAMIAAAVVTARKVMSGPHLSGGSAFLSALRLGGPLIGLLGACYVAIICFIGMSNMPSPVSFEVITPGLAEAALSFGLGLMAGITAVIGHWIVEARIDRAVLSA